MVISSQLYEYMKIAVCTEHGDVFQHFGATPEFTVFTIDRDKITDEKAYSTNGTGHEALVDILIDLNAEILICGGIGGGARNAITSVGIELLPGVTGNAREAVEALMKGALCYDPGTSCQHHEHADGGCSGHCHH